MDCKAPIIVLTFFFGVFGCSWDQVKETGYGILQEHRIDQCLNDPTQQSAYCLERQSYETYQRERQNPPL